MNVSMQDWLALNRAIALTAVIKKIMKRGPKRRERPIQMRSQLAND